MATVDARAYTPEEVQDQLIGLLRQYARYWSELPGANIKYAVEGMAFSMLVILDGDTDLPAFDLVLRPHPDDQAFHVERGEEYYQDGMVINADVALHEIFAARR